MKKKNAYIETPVFQYKTVPVDFWGDFFSSFPSSYSDFLNVSGQVTSFLCLSSIFQSG